MLSGRCLNATSIRTANERARYIISVVLGIPTLIVMPVLLRNSQPVHTLSNIMLKFRLY